MPAESNFVPDFIKDSANVHALLSKAGLGLWEIKLESNTVSWDDHCKQLFGLAKDNNLNRAIIN